MEYEFVKESSSTKGKPKSVDDSTQHIPTPNPLAQQGMLVISTEPFQIVSSNSSAVQITGFDSDEINAFSKEQLILRIHPDDRERVLMHFSSEPIDGSQCQCNSIRIERKDGTILKIDVTAIRVEIAEQHCHIITMRETDSLSFMENVIESLTHPFYVINASDYTIRMANRAASLGELTGSETCYELTHQLERPCFEFGHTCPLQEVVSTKKPAFVEHEHYNDDGTLRFMEVHAYPIFDSEGNVAEVIEYDLDVTEQKTTEKELENESKRARLFLDILAHDVANQLQILWGTAEILRESYGQEEDALIHRCFNQIEESARTCTEMIAQARCAEGLAIAPVADRSLIRALFDCIHDLAENHENLRMSIKINIATAFILADKYLERLIGNLLDNAVAHNPADTKHIWVELRSSGSGYEIIVGDNGPGIKDEIKSVLFNPFHRIGGLGIHLSKEIAEKYGGRLLVRDRVHEESDKGAEFLIWLPQIGGLVE
ncbi:MAG: ATP-binding protein [Candidatus Thorarchaeota archaeon]|jgi:signal transduction histidine kinase